MCEEPPLSVILIIAEGLTVFYVPPYKEFICSGHYIASVFQTTTFYPSLFLLLNKKL